MGATGDPGIESCRLSNEQALAPAGRVHFKVQSRWLTGHASAAILLVQAQKLIALRLLALIRLLPDSPLKDVLSAKTHALVVVRVQGENPCEYVLGLLMTNSIP